jgi:hypothetical protein
VFFLEEKRVRIQEAVQGKRFLEAQFKRLGVISAFLSVVQVRIKQHGG